MTFSQQIKQMEFISAEAEEDGPLVFSDDEEDEKTTDELVDFIDDSTQPQFHGQTRDPIEAIYENNDPFYSHGDQQPELYAPEDRKHVSFDKFKDFDRSMEKFKNTLKNLRIVKIRFLTL